MVVLSLAVLVLQARRLNALMIGDEASRSQGVDPDRLRLLLLCAAAALTAAAISVAGGVGFVGLVAPHCVRLLLGPDHRVLLPATALVGGLFLVLADMIGRVTAAPAEVPLNVVTAVLGVPFFLWLLRRTGRVEVGAR